MEGIRLWMAQRHDAIGGNKAAGSAENGGLGRPWCDAWKKIRADRGGTIGAVPKEEGESS
jgi:hypothetical protein